MEGLGWVSRGGHLEGERGTGRKGKAMSGERLGYMGRLLRVDLTDGTVRDEPLEPEMAEKYLGGTGFGVEYLYREVPPGVQWDDPGNRIIMASGPMGGTPVAGSGTFPRHESDDDHNSRRRAEGGSTDEIQLRRNHARRISHGS